jgi:beta-galactosidase
VDSYVTPFGIRHARFDKDQGFFLNGTNMKLKGVNLHHDAGLFGAAVPVQTWERRLKVLKELGCNAIRSGHTPRSPGFLDLCDRMGFLVVAEIFDKWNGTAFHEWWDVDLESTLRRDRNHPGIILWMIGNELMEQGSPEGNRMLRKLVDFVHEHEPTRPVACAITPVTIAAIGDREKRVNQSGFAEIMDVVTQNYSEPWYESDRARYPNRIMLGTEAYPYYRGKGDGENADRSHKGYVERNPWLDVAEHDYIAGQFVWPGIDYLGEGHPWPSKGNASGLIDTCGFRKARSYFHQSVWSDEPMVHLAVFDASIVYPLVRGHWGWPKIASHWTFPHFVGQTVKLVTYTNCESVEVLVNGKSQGRKKLSDFPDLYMIWRVPYEPGTAKAIGRNGDEVVAEYDLRTAGKAARIVLKPDRTRLAPDAQDVCHVEVNVTDQQGVLCPHAGHLISFALEGPARIVGVDNGDLDSHQPYLAREETAFHGKCLVVIRSTTEPGPIRLTATSPGLASGRVLLEGKNGF